MQELQNGSGIFRLVGDCRFYILRTQYYPWILVLPPIFPFCNSLQLLTPEFCLLTPDSPTRPFNSKIYVPPPRNLFT